jgi:hypothetical protein
MMNVKKSLKPNLQISTPFSLPFMFSSHQGDTQVSTSSSDRRTCDSEHHASKLKNSFHQELEKMGVSAKLIPDKNPLKQMNSRNNSPSTTGLPFQRRCRSNSPVNKDLQVVETLPVFFFPPRSPVVGSHKMKFREDFTGLCKNSGHFEVEEDDDLKNLKEEYRKMLQNANCEFFDSSDEIGDEGEVEEIEQRIGINRRRYFK